jgi:hypothetical protein
MRIETLKKKLNTEFNFTETHDSLEQAKFNSGIILLTPNYREKQRPWMQKAYNEWLKGDKTIVLISPLKDTCRYFKKFVTDVAEVRRIPALSYSTLRASDGTYKSHKVKNPMIVAVYWKIIVGEPEFCVSFD